MATTATVASYFICAPTATTLAAVAKPATGSPPI